MKTFKVSFEIQVDANCPLEAAKKVNEMMDYHLSDLDACGWQFYVQEDESTEVFSVDLDEEDENAVLPITDYKPLIN